MKLPNFSLSEYAGILDKLDQAGYQFAVVSQMPFDSKKKTVYLRHDIDLHLTKVDEIARVEAEKNIRSTFYVSLTQPYNIFYFENQLILQSIQELGHEIGLHYDLETYPVDLNQARAHLEWEVSVLRTITGSPVHTISMHQPHTGQPDLFRMIDEFVHPHDPRFQEDILYVSDSCRAWRDESLMTCFGLNPPRRLLLTTHPELWLNGDIPDRISYLDQIVMIHGLNQQRDYYDRVVRRLWETYPGANQHDLRESKRGNPSPR
jgi:peptidoglycan/xylan/chitin deacetylase (PgdA/CDA1 family)